ncbi:hypothetical protein Cyrtocomes_00317 [Candidatus Cyrtobacter comes]|uniref:DUF4836 family protein n=2 Tax=Candidatus Cyrtobacter comes TaxID=675776 RepID=A0ABU5L756_9RICK|nr:hypothetical protein [Candidatus Cyrtobacter comes]
MIRTISAILLFLLACNHIISSNAFSADTDVFTVCSSTYESFLGNLEDSKKNVMQKLSRECFEKFLRKVSVLSDFDTTKLLEDFDYKTMVSSFNITSQRETSTSYGASVCFTFNKKNVKPFLLNHGFIYFDKNYDSLLIISVLDEETPSYIWSGNSVENFGLIKPAFLKPDLEDLIKLRGINFLNAKYEDFLPILKKYGFEDLAITIVKKTDSLISIKVRLIGNNHNEMHNLDCRDKILKDSGVDDEYITFAILNFLDSWWKKDLSTFKKCALDIGVKHKGE